MSLETKDRNYALDFIRNVNDKAPNKTLSNLYIFFLAQSQEKVFSNELNKYLEHLEILQKRNQPLLIDKDFALNVCKHFKRTESQIRVYGLLEFHEEAVKLAISEKEYELAKHYANEPSDEKIRKKLWLEIAKSSNKHNTDESKTGFEILKDGQYLTVADILPFVSPQVKLAKIRDIFVSSLEKYDEKISKLNSEIDELKESSGMIELNNNQKKNSQFVVPNDQCCEKCKAPLLGCDKIYIYPCLHGYHKDCLLDWISAFKMYFPAGKISRVERIEAIRLKIVQLNAKKRAIEESEQEMEGRGFLSSLGTFFKRSKKQQEEEKHSSLSPEDAESLRILERQLEELLGSECFLCGTLFIETLDMPFDSADEYYWSIFY